MGNDYSRHPCLARLVSVSVLSGTVSLSRAARTHTQMHARNSILLACVLSSVWVCVVAGLMQQNQSTEAPHRCCSTWSPHPSPPSPSHRRSSRPTEQAPVFQMPRTWTTALVNNADRWTKFAEKDSTVLNPVSGTVLTELGRTLRF